MTETTLTKPVITLKNIDHHAGLSQETHAYTATIYVDGKRWAEVSNAGHGGCDDVHPFSGGHVAVEALEARIKATYPKRVCDLFPDGMEESLESICCELVNAYLFEKEWKPRMRRHITAINDGEIYTWPARFKPTPEMLVKFRAKFPNHTVLNDLPFDEAAKLIRATA